MTAAFSTRLGERPDLSAHPSNAIRKMANNYGWDWGPALITAGTWRRSPRGVVLAGGPASATQRATTPAEI